jgi:hypothetical protein
MNAAKVVNSVGDMSVCDFCAYRVEEATAGADSEPYVL